MARAQCFMTLSNFGVFEVLVFDIRKNFYGGTLPPGSAPGEGSLSAKSLKT